MSDEEEKEEGGEDAYRNLLVETIQKSEESYDKAILTLSAGALGISFAFYSDIIGDGPVVEPGLLIEAWGLWAASLVLVVVSFLTSQWALKQALDDYDDGVDVSKAFNPFNQFTILLNVLSGILFLSGVVKMIMFVHANIGA